MTIVFGWKQIGQHITGEAIGDQFEYSVSISDKWQNNSSWRRHHWMARMDRIWVMLRLTAWRRMVFWEQIGKDIHGKMAGGY